MIIIIDFDDQIIKFEHLVASTGYENGLAIGGYLGF